LLSSECIGDEDDVREEYWRTIRSQPDSIGLTAFRSRGVHGTHATR
jgi:hypothetical protein